MRRFTSVALERDRERQPQAGRHAQHRRKLHGTLQRAPDDRSPGQDHRQARQRRLAAEHDERGDHRGVPHHRGGVREQKPAMAVEHAQAPRRQHQQPGARKQDAHELNRERALIAVEPGRDEIDEQRRGEHAGEDDRAHHQREERQDGAGHAVGIAPLALCDERRVDRDERRRQRAFAEQILQNVGNAERRAEGVGFGAEAEVVREDALPDQAGQPRQQDAGRRRGTRNAQGTTQARAESQSERSVLTVACARDSVPSSSSGAGSPSVPLDFFIR